MRGSWIRAFNAGGIDALLDNKRRGRPRLLDAQNFTRKVVPMLADPAMAGEHHWTAVKLHGHLTGTLRMELGYSTLVRHLHEHGWVQRIPRPWPLAPSDEGWEQKRAAFRPQLAALLTDPKAVAPATGACSALIFAGCDTDVFQTFLDTLSADFPPVEGRRFYLVLDNASWYKSRRLRWHHFQPVYLPTCCLHDLVWIGRLSPLRYGCPDFNAIARLWLHLKSQWFAGFSARTTDVLMERLTRALQSLFANPDLFASQCRITAEDY